MVKLIFVALLLQSWILRAQNTLHCIPVAESEVIHEMAGKYLGAADALLNRDARIVTLEKTIDRGTRDYETRISILTANLADQKAISADFQKHSQSFADQLTYYEKINRKQKRQNTGLKIALGLAGSFIIFQAVR